MKKHQQELDPGKFYHIFNRGNNSEKIFFKQENYEFFLRRYTEYVSDCIETYAYCLLPNHFHFLVRVKEKALHLADAKLLASPTPSQSLHRLFTSYCKAINKQEIRYGSLIENPFKRIQIESNEYFTNLVVYIHTNPQLHGFVNDFSKYSWSSYNIILNNSHSFLQKSYVLDQFEDKENYRFCHLKKINLLAIEQLIFE